MSIYLTPEELAEQLRIDVDDVMSLIDQRKLSAIRIGNNIRIREAEVEKLHLTCAAVPITGNGLQALSPSDNEALPPNSRWCLTRTGKARFGISGSIAAGAEIWPGQMQYPIKFPKHFMDVMLERFRGAEVPVGGKFDDPGRGSLGEFIQQKLKTKMNPAVYLAALLIDEGYADPVRRGYIQFRARSPKPSR